MFTLPEFLQRVKKVAVLSEQQGISMTDAANQLAQEEQLRRQQEQAAYVNDLVAAINAPAPNMFR